MATQRRFKAGLWRLWIVLAMVSLALPRPAQADVKELEKEVGVGGEEKGNKVEAGAYKLKIPRGYSKSKEVPGNNWTTSPREDGSFTPITVVVFRYEPDPAPPLEKQLDDTLSGLKSYIRWFSHTEPAHGKIGALNACRSRWCGISNSSIPAYNDRDLEGVCYLIANESAIVAVYCMDYYPHCEQSLKTAEAAALSVELVPE